MPATPSFWTGAAPSVPMATTTGSRSTMEGVKASHCSGRSTTLTTALARRAANAIFDRMERRSAEGRKALAYKSARAQAVREGKPLPPPPWAERQ